MATFINELEQLHTLFESDPVNAGQKGIEQATSMALSTLLRTPAACEKFTQGARAVALQGKKLYRVETWTGRGPRFGEFAMADILVKGNFIRMAQDFLDETYGKGFRIFHHKLVQENSFSLSISWDQEQRRPASNYHGKSKPWVAPQVPLAPPMPAPFGGQVSPLTEPNSICLPKEKIKIRRKEIASVPDYNL